MDLEELKRNINAIKVKLLKEDEMAEFFPGCEVGAQLAFGSLFHMPTFLSEHFNKEKDLYFNGGTHTDLIRVPYQEFDAIELPYITNFSKPISKTAR